MKKFLKSVLLLWVMLLFWSTSSAQEKVKTGWNVGPLPAVSYNSDLGFQYGVLCDLYWFGDGSTYPEYLHKFNAEVSRYTKGSGTYHLFYDSKYLLRGLRTTIAVSYLTDRMMDFYGFNGYNSVYDNEKGASYYKIDRNLFRSTADFQGSIVKNLGWAMGIGYYHYATGPVKTDEYEGAANLYSEYVKKGIIGSDEKDGGGRVELKLGIVHDTRDHEADPYRGFKSEAIFLVSPGKSVYTKLLLTNTGYIPIAGNKLTFAYRLAYQGTLTGEQPFYMLQNISTLYLKQIRSEGLGGQNSLRGILRNRVVGAGVVWGNAELRYRFAKFTLLNQNWYAAVNPFFDAGRVVSHYRKDLLSAAELEEMHLSAGFGIKLVMNRNFIISGEWGKPLCERDGGSGLYIGLNFIF